MPNTLVWATVRAVGQLKLGSQLGAILDDCHRLAVGVAILGANKSSNTPARLGINIQVFYALAHVVAILSKANIDINYIEQHHCFPVERGKSISFIHHLPASRLRYTHEANDTQQPLCVYTTQQTRLINTCR